MQKSCIFFHCLRKGERISPGVVARNWKHRQNNCSPVSYTHLTNPQLGAATPKVTDPQYFGTGLGIAVRPDNKALLEKLNAALKAIKADGTYQKISNQWFPE